MCDESASCSEPGKRGKKWPLILASCFAIGLGTLCSAADWPQLQANAARTGRTVDSVPGPYRARWVWLGASQTLRNRDSVAGWPDDLRSREGYSYPNLPGRVNYTFADSVQPVLVYGRLYVGSMDGVAYAINAQDGSTVWTAGLPAGTVAAAAVTEEIVVIGTVSGWVVGLRTRDGSRAWSFDSGKAITGAPCLSHDRLFVATHGGEVVALNPINGSLLWRSPRFGAPIYGGLACDGVSVFTGAEDMHFYALDASNGAVRSSHRLSGQSFRMLWPVVFRNLVWVSTVMTPIIGSEYIGETNSGSSLFADASNLTGEEDNLRRWLNGDTNGGRWPDAGADWRHLFALSVSNLSEPFSVAAGPADGVGVPVHPVVVDNSDRVLTYFKTSFPTLTTKVGSVFGTHYTIDIGAVDQTTGRRLPIDNGHLANIWPWEMDNLYGLSVAGSQLWLRQNFRGTMVADLSNSTERGVSAPIRHHDGGNFMWDVVYRDQDPPIATSQAPWLGRTAPIIVENKIYFAENWGITCIESAK